MQSPKIKAYNNSNHEYGSMMGSNQFQPNAPSINTANLNTDGNFYSITNSYDNRTHLKIGPSVTTKNVRKVSPVDGNSGYGSYSRHKNSM